MVRAEDVLDVIEGMGTSIDPAKLKVDASLSSQGFDSLDLATLMLELETKFGKPMPPENAARLRTIEQLVDYLNQ